MQAELDKVRHAQETSERDLRSQIHAMTNEAQGGNEWKVRYEALNQSQQELRAELSEQERLTDEVRQETVDFLEQVKALSQRGTEAIEREDRFTTQIQKLETELKDWKSRYAQVKTDANAARYQSSMSVHPPNPVMSLRAGGLVSHDGLIKALHITKYQVAIDEMLYRARSDQMDTLLASAKTVAIAIRNIMMDTDNHQWTSPEAQEQCNQLKSKVAATANNLITAAKNLVLSEGLSPVSLLDAAASHLSAALIGLARLAKVDPSPTNEFEDDGNMTDIVDSPADYYGINDGRISVGAESTYSTDSKPRLTSRAFSGSNQRKPLSNGITNGVPAPPSFTESDIQDGRFEELKVC